MKYFSAASFITSCLLAPAALSAQEQGDEADEESIIVEGLRWQEQLEVVEEQAEAVIRPVRNGDPAPRFFDRICLTTWGIDPGFAAVLTERVKANAIEAGARINDDPDCRPNALVAMVSDLDSDFAKLRKDHAWIFGEMKRFQIDRARQGSGAAAAWNVTELRGKDGVPFSSVDANDIAPASRPAGTPVAVNTQRSASLVRPPIRQDMIFSVAIFDEGDIAGRTIRQLADYATMRLLAPVKEPETEPPATAQTILSLFSFPEAAPEAITGFDKAFLRALYLLPSTARDSQLIDATSSEYRKQLKTSG
ncbi:hypothetical protein [Erythrobacter rubeus]|uniref:Uncharacterized protein n=1 Tax=Erythrobacter rubeus TaxID=2760803 RepID=A0ABR8KLQ2_9SPHN|nr:hypothetical protein [Erythrobacter rubeus]MBD2841356.1 hypothetical protein [Erythrobacter rubeus]